MSKVTNFTHNKFVAKSGSQSAEYEVFTIIGETLSKWWYLLKFIASPVQSRIQQEKLRLVQINREYLDQKDICLVHPKWGKLVSKYVILNRDASLDNPPIVVIPGTSNGIESMDVLVKRLAQKQPDRRLLMISYPDAPSGSLTKSFHDAVDQAAGFEPHSLYFQAAINSLLPKEDFEIWGYSAGGAIIETLCAFSPIAKRITNAVLICPGGSVRISPTEFKLGLVAENALVVERLKKLAKHVLIEDKSTPEQKKLKLSTWLHLGEHCCRPVADELIPKMKTSNSSGKIVIISADKDKVVQSAKKFNQHTAPLLRSQNSQLEIVNIPSALHVGPFLEPDIFIDQALSKLNRTPASISFQNKI